MAKKKFDWGAFKLNPDACVHCKTKNEAEQFVKLMLQHNIIIYTDVKADNLLKKYEVYKENTVYYSDGCYDSIQYANKEGHQIMMFDKYDFS